MYICMYMYMYICQNDKEIKPSHQVLSVSYKHALQSSVFT